MNNDPLELDYEWIGNEDRYRSVGLTNGGRFLLVVWSAPSPRFPQRLKQEGFSGEIPMKKQTKRIVPWFATAEEEADWWYKNRKVHDKELLDAVRSGEAQILTREKLLARIEASKKKPAPVVALRIPAADLALARSRRRRRACLTRTTLNQCCTRLSPSAKSARRGGPVSLTNGPSHRAGARGAGPGSCRGRLFARFPV